MTATTGSDDALSKVEKYHKAVLNYEELQQQINALLRANDGSSDEMSELDRKQYRELARQRDEAMNEMRWLENQLLEED